ncbi:hypothetical protein B0I35DRAFT_424737 [Stachybotrys elegans]|uniref:Secreted protein n=1 Tax=Stachybotrys elegans TaxID=80388 RepID=A0A8K0T2Y1_9HYPO|nr:hypothetical protein B0I35DRAFT_424737 [Stachybotrys elegans]
MSLTLAQFWSWSSALAVPICSDPPRRSVMAAPCGSIGKHAANIGSSYKAMVPILKNERPCMLGAPAYFDRRTHLQEMRSRTTSHALSLSESQCRCCQCGQPEGMAAADADRQ